MIVIGCRTTPTDRYIADLKGGRVQNDTSPVYVLPYEPGSSHLLVQAYHSKLSHRGEYALDFKMKTGSKVCAARDGVVTSTREDSDKGGLKDEYLGEGNHIIILHADRSQAMYWHLKKDGVVVNVGDTVRAGQLIGYSGNTGYSAFPHLHFEVNAYTGTGNFEQVPTRFYTNSGIRYLRPGKYYRAVTRISTGRLENKTRHALICPCREKSAGGGIYSPPLTNTGVAVLNPLPPVITSVYCPAPKAGKDTLLTIAPPVCLMVYR